MPHLRPPGFGVGPGSNAETQQVGFGLSCLPMRPIQQKKGVHRALPGKATLVFAKSWLRNLAKHRKQIVTQAPRHGPYLRSTCACAAAQEHQDKGTLLAIGVAIPFIPLIPVSYCFINRDAGDEGDWPLQVGESCLDLPGLWRAPRQSAKNQKTKHDGDQRDGQ